MQKKLIFVASAALVGLGMPGGKARAQSPDGASTQAPPRERARTGSKAPAAAGSPSGTRAESPSGTQAGSAAGSSEGTPRPARPMGPPPRVAVTSLQAHGVNTVARPRLLKALGGGLAVAGLKVLAHGEVLAQLAGSAGLTGCETAVCLKKIGELTRAPVCARAAVESTENTYRIEVVLTDAATGKVAVRVERHCDVCTLKEATESLSQTAQDAGKKLRRIWTPRRSAATPPERQPPPRSVVNPPPPPTRPDDKSRQYRLAGFITLGAGVAALIPGAVLLGLDGKTQDSGCGAPLCVYKTRAVGGFFTGLGVGALAAGGALLVYSILRRGKERPRRVSVGVAPLGRGAWVQGTVRF